MRIFVCTFFPFCSMSSQTGLQAGTGAKGSKKGRGADDHDESDVKGEEEVSGKKGRDKTIAKGGSKQSKSAKKPMTAPRQSKTGQKTDNVSQADELGSRGDLSLSVSGAELVSGGAVGDDDAARSEDEEDVEAQQVDGLANDANAGAAATESEREDDDSSSEDEPEVPTYEALVTFFKQQMQEKALAQMRVQKYALGKNEQKKAKWQEAVNTIAESMKMTELMCIDMQRNEKMLAKMQQHKKSEVLVHAPLAKGVEASRKAQDKDCVGQLSSLIRVIDEPQLNAQRGVDERNGGASGAHVREGLSSPLARGDVGPQIEQRVDARQGNLMGMSGARNREDQLSPMIRMSDGPSQADIISNKERSRQTRMPAQRAKQSDESVMQARNNDFFGDEEFAHLDGVAAQNKQQRSDAVQGQDEKAWAQQLQKAAKERQNRASTNLFGKSIIQRMPNWAEFQKIGTIREFMGLLNDTFNLVHVAEEERIGIFAATMGSEPEMASIAWDAHKMNETSNGGQFCTWEEFSEHVIATKEGKSDMDDRKVRVMTMKQPENTTVAQYLHQFKQRHKEAHMDINSASAARRFVSGLAEPLHASTATALAGHIGDYTLQHAVDTAKNLENQIKRQGSVQVSVRPTPTCEHCGKTGHTLEQCWLTQKGKKQSEKVRAMSPAEEKNSKSYGSGSNTDFQDKKQMQCHRCGKLGHLKRECRTRMDHRDQYQQQQQHYAGTNNSPSFVPPFQQGPSGYGANNYQAFQNGRGYPQQGFAQPQMHPGAQQQTHPMYPPHNTFSQVAQQGSMQYPHPQLTHNSQPQLTYNPVSSVPPSSVSSSSSSLPISHAGPSQGQDHQQQGSAPKQDTGSVNRQGNVLGRN